MFWALASVFEAIKNEYRGWLKFKQATGMWPVFSVAVGLFSLPALFAAGIYAWISALETHNLPIIYSTLFAAGVGGAAVWYGLRRLACKIDVSRAPEIRRTEFAAENLENLIR